MNTILRVLSSLPRVVWVGALAAVALVVVLAVWGTVHAPQTFTPGSGAAPATGPGSAAASPLLFHVPVGRVHAPLPYRIISFHRGRVDKDLIRLAASLGFNGVQIQLEGSTVQGLIDLARRDAAEHIFDYCHQLGMQVTVWVHEFNDFPAEWMPEYQGPFSVDNPRIWADLDARYDWVLGQAIPQADGLVLTVVETGTRATQTPELLQLTSVIAGKCQKYHKTFMARTFVWYPEEFASVMGAVARMPADTIIMSKIVPQDWQMRGTFAREIGAVGGRPQIIEYDIAGEYFLKNQVANCMPALLKTHFDYGQQHAQQGICVRVDRDEANVLHQPSEVNLWTLGMLAAGASDNLDEIWEAWATYRFGKAAAAGVVRALKPTEAVVSEMLSIGPFAFGDTRHFPPLGNETGVDDFLGQNHQNWRWDSRYLPWYRQAETGDPAFAAQVQAGKNQALQMADNCLANLQEVRGALAPEDYAILYTRLLTNKVQLSWRAPMALAVLHYRHLLAINPRRRTERRAAAAVLAADLAAIRQAALPVYDPPQKMDYRDRTWLVGVPEGVDRGRIYYWAWQMEQLLRELVGG